MSGEISAHHITVEAEGFWSLEAFSTAQEATVVEHAFARRIQRPVVAFPRVAGFARDLDEAIVQGQVVSDGVLPDGEFFPVVRESVDDKVADFAES